MGNKNSKSISIKEDYNYHFSSGSKVDNNTPYLSDNKYRMMGNRSTGHFGSGIYFSTYKVGCDKNEKTYDYDFRLPFTPEFIEIDDNVYRVDLDIYQNLYKVESEKEGKVLFTLLKNINLMYNNVSYKHYSNSLYYQICKNNSGILGLNIPDYRSLTKMMREHSLKKDDVRSFSTVFMEYNGYNGVNVSGIKLFDNTTHGSVVYDLSKVSDKKIKTKTPVIKSFGDEPYYNTIATKDYFPNSYEESLKGEKNLFEMEKMDDKTAYRIMRNLLDNGVVLNGRELSYIKKPKIVKKYLRLLYVYNVSTRFVPFKNLVYDYDLYDVITETDSFYWVNYETSHGQSILSSFLRKWFYENYGNDDTSLEDFENYLSSLMIYMKRDLTEDEKDDIEDYRNDFK